MRWVPLKEFFRNRTTPRTFSIQSAPLAVGSTFDSQGLGEWYSPVILAPSTAGSKALSSACLRQAMQILQQLEPDDYSRYLLGYYQAGLERFGDAWPYADIVTVLLAVAQLIRPKNYLEIGVRRGRSMAMVAASCPGCEIIGLDMWKPNYAGMPNPGPDFVQAEMKKFNHKGRVELISGNSHEVLPRYFDDHPKTFFDLITVDGDHSKRGAIQDLSDVLPRLKVGGVIVFDDICHPAHPYMFEVWQEVVASDPRFSTWHFTELGYGVALAVRKC